MTNSSSIHSGHRQRLKRLMLEANFNGISDINLLEAVLFYSISRSDTNEIAHRLLQAFGSVEAVFEADYDDLLQVEGIGEHSAFLIKLVNKSAKRMNESSRNKAVMIGGNQSAADVFKPYFVGEKDEKILAMYLDNAHKLIRVDVLGTGVVNTVSFDIRKLLEGAVRTNAVTVILAHNHPHGFPNPSNDDLNLTQKARNILRTVGINLYDHLINADDTWFSMREMDNANLYLTPIKKPKEEKKKN